MRIKSLSFALCAAAFCLAGAAQAGNYEFRAAPRTDLNRIFRVDRTTGEVGACQYGLKKDTAIGVTMCWPAGEGAKAMGAPGEYSLISSSHTGEDGVFRIDLKTGMMSVCFVLNDAVVVCTPPSK